MRRDFALSAAQKADARDALQVLEGSGITLGGAARRVLFGKRATKRIEFVDAVDQFIRSRMETGCRDITVQWYYKMLEPAEKKFGEKFFDAIERAELFAWLKEYPVSVHTRAGMSRALRALWRWGLTHEPQLVTLDITPGLRTDSPRSEGDAKFHTVEQAAQLLAGAERYRSAAALVYFAGLRPEEIAGEGKPRLTWKQVNVEEKIIRVPAEIAKTGKPRIIEGIPETVWHWLKPGRENEPILKAHSRELARTGRKLLGEWSHDVMRHTCATYLLAATGDAGKVSTWIGHEGKPTLLHRNYKGLATKVEGEKFLALRPA